MGQGERREKKIQSNHGKEMIKKCHVMDIGIMISSKIAFETVQREKASSFKGLQMMDDQTSNVFNLTTLHLRFSYASDLFHGDRC